VTDFGRRRGTGDMLRSVYDTDHSGVVDQTPAHKATHQDEGDDEVSVDALSGELADLQYSTWDMVSGKPTAYPPTPHKTSHGEEGTDPVNVTGLVGTTPRAILGDATAGRVFRGIYLVVDNGVNGVSLKCTVGSRWNGDVIAETDDIVKGQTTGHFSLSADGTSLTIEAAGLSGNVLYANGEIHSNASETPLTAFLRVVNNDINYVGKDAATAATLDLTTLVDTGAIILNILYITDA